MIRHASVQSLHIQTIHAFRKHQINYTCSDCLITVMVGLSTSLPGQKVSRNDNKQRTLLGAEMVTQPTLSCPLSCMFLSLREPDGSDCTSLPLITVSSKSFSVLCTWPCEVIEVSFILCKTVAAIVLEPTLYWRLTLEDPKEERPLGFCHRSVDLLWTPGCKLRKVPALLVSLWLTDTLGTTTSLSIPALYLTLKYLFAHILIHLQNWTVHIVKLSDIFLGSGQWVFFQMISGRVGSLEGARGHFQQAVGMQPIWLGVWRVH